ncbi:tRNA wybutosine-synthesizing protein 2 [Mortierella alpina]|uniref:tRNA(Phe) (4-demethylwyosine(37)-C(7)) aminocarboxypropyltransferase n=1 Tax=Mortierella alpina TaxID=64518 RepID=A0A9P6JBP6_MORAP|nr:tRNA wybutosine-synthesizing protein 2 [Mortierella alpina]
MPSTIPVLLAPTHLTKHLKVFLDTAGWRDRTRLITRYSQITEAEGDLASYMAMALLPLGPFSTLLGTEAKDMVSLWELLEGSAGTHYPLALPPAVADPLTLRSIFVVHLAPSAFAAPKHLLVQTPLEKLQQGVSDFLTPFLHTWEQETLDIQSNDSPLGLDDLPRLLASLPQKWEHYSDFTLLPPSAFLTAPWPTVMKRLVARDQEQALSRDPVNTDDRVMAKWERLIQDALQSSHIARKAIIPVNDILRRPTIRPLTGDWKLHNRYKSWIEDDLHLLEHKEVDDDTTARNNTPSNAAESLQPTKDHFRQAYWAETCQNHVWYTWAPMFTMFSAGNITEKERVAKSRPIFDAQGKTVVDLYAGIGYFALVYLIHAGAKVVHACEWNPWSVEGLAQGASRNEISWKKHLGVSVAHNGAAVSSVAKDIATPESTSDEAAGSQGPLQTFETSPERAMVPGKKAKSYGNLVIYPGDNAQWIDAFENQAHHVNLGLIPSAEPGWVLGVRALCPREGGYLHVHHNIRVGEEEAFKTYLLDTLHNLFALWKTSSASWSIHIRHMENVKSFAPLVFHYVIDVECRPPILAL